MGSLGLANPMPYYMDDSNGRRKENTSVMKMFFSFYMCMIILIKYFYHSSLVIFFLKTYSLCDFVIVYIEKKQMTMMRFQIIIFSYN